MVVKLNGGLGTSMGLDRAKSLLEVRDGLSFLDIIARQVLAAAPGARRHAAAGLHGQLPHHATTPSRRSTATTLAVDGLPLDFLQNKEPKLRTDDLTPVTWEADPDLEWCPPGHGDLYTALRGTGLLQRLIDAGYQRVVRLQLRQPRRHPGPAGGGLVRPLRRAVRHRGGPPYARRTARAATSRAASRDGRLVLRETAQTLDEDKDALADLSRHRFCSTNNLWFDLRRDARRARPPRRHPRSRADQEPQDRRPGGPLAAPR